LFADGSHIKGLVINFFRCFWPKLLQPPTDVAPKPLGNEPPFLASFVTPLLKASRKGKKNTKDTLAFYSTAEYNSWRNEMGPESLQGWSVKYYKGLGTSTPAEAKEYFSAFVNNLRPFRWKSDADGDMLDMVFDKKRASHRKQWILDKYDMEASVVVDPSEENAVSYEDFVNKEMIHFSHADNIRSIPSVVDGLKPSQRKVLYACFKRNLRSEIKVAQLSGYWYDIYTCMQFRLLLTVLTSIICFHLIPVLSTLLIIMGRYRCIQPVSEIRLLFLFFNCCADD
jgi:DNA topoisomerase II